MMSRPERNRVLVSVEAAEHHVVWSPHELFAQGLRDVLYFWGGEGLGPVHNYDNDGKVTQALSLSKRAAWKRNMKIEVPV